MLLGGFFSAKIGKHQLLWLPCEVEALCINLTITSFSHIIRESENTTKFLTDSKSCVQAFQKLEKGGFSLSPRISSYLMNLNALNVSINHISGTSIKLTDFSSRNPIQCNDEKCQVCHFVNENLDLAVRTLTATDVEEGLVKMPYYNHAMWIDAQKKDPELKRCFSQLSSGTRPGKKERNLQNLRRYLQVASISQNGMLISRKSNPFGKDYELIIVPSVLASGLISALHIKLQHPTKTQFKRVFNRYFFVLNGDFLIDDITNACTLCNSLKTIPRELVQQGTTAVPATVGNTFAADVICRERQKILVAIDLFSSFMVGCFVPNEKQESLRQGLIQLVVNYKHPDGCEVRVDHAKGFEALKNDKVLLNLGITLDFGRVKNKNQNSCVDKAIQELEKEIIRLAPEGGMISLGTLAIAISNLNHRVRSNGLCAKEVLVKRDMFTNEQLSLDDRQIQDFKYDKRIKNHPSSELSKSRGTTESLAFEAKEGDIVHVKGEGSKHHARDFYLVTSVHYPDMEAEIQKFCGNEIRKKKYRVSFSQLFPAGTNFVVSNGQSDDTDGADVTNGVNNESHLNQSPLREDEVTNDANKASTIQRRSKRNRHRPDYLSTDEIRSLPYDL